MIYETETTVGLNPVVQGSALVQQALAWARGPGLAHALGRVDLWGDDMYVMVQQRKPLSRAQRDDPEAHRTYVDLQYCVAGGEFIDWYPIAELKSRCDYDAERDVQLFYRPDTVAPVPLPMRPGCFALLFPGDAHVPVVADGKHEECRMIVFKIRLSALLAEQT